MYSKSIFIKKIYFTRLEILRNSRLAVFPFLIFFIGTVLYQILVFELIIPPFLGGYVTFGIVIGGLFAFVYSIKKIRVLSQEQMKFLTLLVLFLLVSAFSVIISDKGGKQLEYLAMLVRFAGVLGISYVTVRFVERVLIRKIVLIFFVILSIYLSYNINGSLRGTVVLLQSGQDFEVLYQLISLMISCCLILSLGKKWQDNIFLYIISLYLIYLFGARTELIATILVIFSYQFVLSSKSRMFFFSCFFIFILCLLLFFQIIDAYLYFPEFLLKDGSFIERQDILNHNLNILFMDSYAFLFGSYGNYEEGKYIHNILSIWFDFGILGMAVFLLLIFFMIVSFFNKKYYIDYISYKIAYVSFLNMIFSIFLFKDYGFLGIPFTFALFLNYTDTSR